MVLIVHGFPNMISALRFEWAWTKPQQSRRLRHLPKKRNNEKKFAYCIRVMCEMLRTGPWNRLPLTIRWLKQEYRIEFEPQSIPPIHMPVEYGPVKSIKVKTNKSENKFEDNDMQVNNVSLLPCSICRCDFEQNSNNLTCFNCKTVYHTTCLAEKFLEKEQKKQLLPIEGSCPSCSAVVLWGDLVRYKHGCYQNSTIGQDDGDFQDWADDLENSTLI